MTEAEPEYPDPPKQMERTIKQTWWSCGGIWCDRKHRTRERAHRCPARKRLVSNTAIGQAVIWRIRTWALVEFLRSELKVPAADIARVLGVHGRAVGSWRAQHHALEKAKARARARVKP